MDRGTDSQLVLATNNLSAMLTQESFVLRTAVVGTCDLKISGRPGLRDVAAEMIARLIGQSAGAWPSKPIESIVPIDSPPRSLNYGATP